MPKLAIIHTAPVNIAPLNALAAELLPDYEVVNLMDDSMLKDVIAGGAVADVEARLVQYARIAEQGGADGILHVCSSIRDLVPRVQSEVQIPIVCIDEAMAETAVRHARRVGVAATLPSTLEPTLALLRRKAAQVEHPVEIVPVLAEGAFARLQAGDAAAHDALLREALATLAEQVDVVVLAQASMARVVETLPAAVQTRFLSSPRLGMEHMKRVLEERAETA
jgi:Asp/Glu/hydantoin racemase